MVDVLVKFMPSAHNVDNSADSKSDNAANRQDNTDDQRNHEVTEHEVKVLTDGQGVQ